MEKQKVKCPGDLPDGSTCGTEVTIGDGEGCCPKCGLDVEAIYRRARHERALKKVMAEPEPKKKKSNDPFSPDFSL
jgi:hypothetical protein